MGTLFRYWIVPGTLRRLPLVALFGLLVPATLFTYYSSLFATRTLRDSDPGVVFLLRQLLMLQYNLLPSLFCTLGLIAGAATIAPERQKQTWEALLLTQMRVTDVVHAKILVLLSQCLFLTLPLYIPLFAAYAHHGSEMLAIRDDHNSNHGIIFGFRHADTARAGLYLVWTSASMLGHLLAGVMLGMAISACCRRVQTALVLCGAIIAGMIGFYIGITNHYYPVPDDENLHAHLAWWPLYPYLSHLYATNSWLPQKWELKLIAEIVWSVILPLACYAVTLWGCRIRRGRKA